MLDQRKLLTDTDWDVLIVLDACRVDYFKAHCGECKTVKSVGARTLEWVRANAKMLNRKPTVIFNGNPVLHRENKHQKLRLSMVNVWERHWGFFTEQNVACCHPMSVNAVILEKLAAGALKGKRIVAWYLQPHTPYIGDPPLRMDWQPSRFSRLAAKHGVGMMRPHKVLKKGKITWAEVQAGYAGNLRVAWDAARYLVAKVSGKVIITSDHSELIGEDDRFGHQPGWGKKFPQLYEVPWLELEGGKLAEVERAKTPDEVMHARLGDLGYE